MIWEFFIVAILLLAIFSLPIRLQLIAEDLTTESNQLQLMIFWRLNKFRVRIFSIRINQSDIYSKLFNRQSAVSTKQQRLLLKKFYDAIAIETLVVDIKCGLSDPAEMGELLGISQAIAAVSAVYLPYEIRFIPEFDSSCLELRANSVFRISVLRLLIAGGESLYLILKNRIFSGK